MAAAYAAHPERFIRAIPQPPRAANSRVDQPASHGGGQHSTISDASLARQLSVSSREVPWLTLLMAR